MLVTKVECIGYLEILEKYFFLITNEIFNIKAVGEKLLDAFYIFERNRIIQYKSKISKWEELHGSRFKIKEHQKNF